jgi:hypothetical protein
VIRVWKEGVVYSGVYGTIGGEEHSANDTISIGDEAFKDYQVAVPPGSHIRDDCRRMSKVFNASILSCSVGSKRSSGYK